MPCRAAAVLPARHRQVCIARTLFMTLPEVGQHDRLDINDPDGVLLYPGVGRSDSSLKTLVLMDVTQYAQKTTRLRLRNLGREISTGDHDPSPFRRAISARSRSISASASARARAS